MSLEDTISKEKIEKGVTKMDIDEVPIEKPKEDKILYVNEIQFDENKSNPFSFHYVLKWVKKL